MPFYAVLLALLLAGCSTFPTMSEKDWTYECIKGEWMLTDGVQKLPIADPKRPGWNKRCAAV